MRMKQQAIVIAAVLMLASAASPQLQHDPAVEQCRANQRLWLAKLENPPPLDVTFDTLIAWDTEMIQCYSVDPSPLNSVKYLNTSEEAGERAQTRFIHFLTRHHLYEQFVSEDAAGLR